MGDYSRQPPNKATTKPVIYLTGFGPFGPHVRNASEAAVNLVSRSSLASELGVELVTEILDVDYAKTLNLVPQQWEQRKPGLVVHVGVSGLANHLTLEQCAHNTGYQTLDIVRKYPPDLCCIPGGSKELKSELPLEYICEALNNKPKLRLKCRLSQDPGRYLCSFVYYMSLDRDRRRVVFVHVPPLNVCPAEDIAESLKEAIVLLYSAAAHLNTAPSASADNSVQKETDGNTTSSDGEKGQTEGVQGIEERGDEEGREGVDGRGNENLAHLSSAMVKMSTDNGQAVKNCSGSDMAGKGNIVNTAEGSS